MAQRGKAQLGDKTVLDVLDLIATALENAAGQPLPEALRRAGLAGVVEVSPGVWHLVAGLEAEQYAEGMRRRLASVST